MKVILVNDTSLYSSHFGCQLVGQTFREQFKRTGMTLLATLPKIFDEQKMAPLLASADLIVVNGEGSIHHGRNRHLIDLANKYPTALMNCVYEENPIFDSVKSLLFCTARESRSASALQEHGCQAHTIPDMIFASSMVRAFLKPPAEKDLGITDSVVKSYKRIGPFKRKVTGNLSAHDITPAEYLMQLSGFQRICAGRFHAAVVCSILGIPFSSWDSNTWKTRGMMEDMGVPHLHFSSREEAFENVPRTFDSRITTYVQAALPKIENAFDMLKKITQEKHGI